MAQALVEQEQRLDQVEASQSQQQEQINQIAQRQTNLDGDTGYVTALAYCRMREIPAHLKFANRLGKLATKMCGELKISVGRVPDERWGKVNSYPVAVLDECNEEMRLAA